MEIIPGKIYKALIQGLSNTTDGKYKVYIPTLMIHDDNFRWCLAKNKIGKYGKWIDPNNKKVYSIGNYIPLSVGMNVEVIFETTHHDSCRIIDLVYDQIPLNKDDQESFYLFGKTKNGTQFYVDEARNITHIQHNKGLANIIMMDDKISISTNEVSDLGTNNFSNVEVGKESIILKVGNSSLIIDESGFTFKTKDNQWEFGSKEMTYKTSKYNIEAEEFAVQANKIFINGLEETHVKSVVTRVSGTQHMSVNGNVVNIDSNTNTTVQSTGSVNIKSNLNMAISCPTNIHLSTFGMLALDGNSTILNGITTVVNGTTLALNGATIFEDSQVIRGIGAASSMATSMVAASKALYLSMKAVDISLTTAFHFNDPFSGMACSIMSETLPGIAQGAPNQMPIVSMVPNFDYINSVVKYMNSNTDIGNIGTIDTLNGIRGNTLLNLHYKNY